VGPAKRTHSASRRTHGASAQRIAAPTFLTIILCLNVVVARQPPAQDISATVDYALPKSFTLNANYELATKK
jgi:hypothetical protein